MKELYISFDKNGESVLSEEKLKDSTNYYDYLVDQYYNHDNKVISDKEFDAYAKSIGRNEELEVPSSNTLKKYKHLSPMTSLGKVNDLNSMQSWIDKVSEKFPSNLFSLEWKADGVSISVYINHFENHPLLALTRGGGVEGEDVTYNISQAPEYKILEKLQETGQKLSMRFEAVIYQEDFLKHSNGRYKDRRSMVSGVVRNKNTDLAKFIHLHIHDIKGAEYEKIIELANKCNIPTLVIEKDIKSEDVVKTMEKYPKDSSKKLEFETDGLVIKSQSQDVRDKLGESDHHPLWALAYKYENEAVIGDVEKIDWQLGKTGKFTPVIILKEPVIFGSREVSRISGGSYGLVLNRYKVRIGSRIVIELANEVIPKIVGTVDSGNEDLTLPENSYVKGEHLFLRDFQPREIDRSEEILGLLGMKSFKGAKIQKLIANGLIKENDTPVACQVLDIKVEDIERIEGFGRKTAENFVNTVQKSKNGIWYGNIIIMMGIANLGWKAAEEIANLTRDGKLDEVSNRTRKFIPHLKHELTDAMKKSGYNIIY